MNGLAAGVGAVLLAATTCVGAGTDSGACSRVPVGSATVFFAGERPSGEITATVVSITPLPELAGFSYELREREGAATRLTWIAPAAMASVHTGSTYRFVVDYVPGFPDASGILVFDGDTLVFAALSDQQLFQHVLERGIPEFELAVGDSACESRGSTKCHRSMTNLPLVVEHGGTRSTLYHGETVRTGDYEVRALSVQRIVYDSGCADAGLPAVSLVIARAPRQQER